MKPLVNKVGNIAAKKSHRFFALVLSSLSIVAVGATIFSFKTTNVEALKIKEASKYEGETPVSSELMKVHAVSSTSSAYGNTYNVTFSTGAKVLIDTNSSYTVNSENSELIEFNDEINAMELEDRKAMQEKIQKGEIDTRLYEGYVYSLESTKEEVVLPSTLSRGTYNKNAFYTISVSEVEEYAASANSVVTTICIPKTITKIHANSFKLASNLKKIRCEFTKDEIPAGWETGWNAGLDLDNPDQVEFGANIYLNRPEMKNANTVLTKLVGDDNVNFILGYNPKDTTKQAMPLEVEYSFEGETEINTLVVEKMNDFDDFDSVGKGIGGDNGLSTTFTFNFDTPVGKKVNFDSLKIHNIFTAQKTGSGWEPKFDERFYAVPTAKFKRNYSLDEFLKFSYKDTTIFNGYTSININVSLVDGGKVYSLLKSSTYKNYKEKIQSGAAYIRYRFTSLKTSKYLIFTDETSTKQKVQTPVAQFILANKPTSVISFVLKDKDFGSGFDAKKIAYFGLKDAVITLDIVDGGIIAPRSNVSTSFGTVIFKTADEANKIIDLNLVVGLIAAGYSVLAVILIAVLFFVFKNKYKNDEFKRLKPKQFFKKAIIYWLCSLVLVLAIVFIVLRSVAFNNAIVVYNPFDIFIIFFSIASVIIIGYFIKNLVVYIQTAKKNKKNRLLGLDKDVVQDGTN